MSDNPFFESWTTPFGIAPFPAIRPDHFAPAFERALAEHRADIEAIAGDPRRPDFDNTIVPLEMAGAALLRVNGVFWNLASADTNDALQAVERDIAPVLAGHYQAIMLDRCLFARIDDLYQRRASLGLDAEQLRVLELTHREFVRGGARLDEAGRARLSAIVERLAELGTRFGQNVLAAERSFLLELDAPGDLAGLPESLVETAARTAAERGLPGRHAVTLARSMVEPFLAFSSRRDLREKIFRAWLSRGEAEGEHDNRPIVSEMVRLRAERAALLGYDTYAAYKLDDTMAKTPAAVRDLLDRVWAPARARAEAEAADLAMLAEAEGQNAPLMPYDWRYFAERLRRERFDLDEAALKPYFALDDMMAAAFDTAGKLFGLTFTPRPDMPVYHPDVSAYEVTDQAGRLVALFLSDPFARPSKRSGAWNSGFRQQHKLSGEVRPIVVNVMNVAKGGEGRPTLLSLDDARTLFHEFGHALHAMLTDVTYPSIAGTSVSRDFVEFPSQLYEHWLLRPEVLRAFARHVDTREPLPEAMLDKIKAARTFNQGFATVEYCASAFVDLAFHTLEPAAAAAVDPAAVEAQELARIGMPGAVAMRHRTPHFTHVFSGDGYSAGYYSYLWSEMLDADGFGAFEEAGDVFDRATGKRLADSVLAAGNRRDPEEAYIAFRGRLPSVDTLLAKRGLA